MPVLAPTRDQPFLYGDSDTPPHLVAFYDHAGDTEVHILDLTPRALTAIKDQFNMKNCIKNIGFGDEFALYIIINTSWEFVCLFFGFSVKDWG